MQNLHKIKAFVLSVAFIVTTFGKAPFVANASTIDFSNAVALSLNTSYAVNIEASNEYQYFKFTPSSTGFYTFESLNLSSGDPLCVLCSNQNYTIIQHDDINSSNRNFKLTYHLVAGTSYYYKARCFGQGVGSYNVMMKSASDVTTLSMSSVSTESSYNVSNAVETKSTYFSFTPNVSGEYLFYSTESSGDPRLWVYNSSLSLVGTNDDSGGNQNFVLTSTLTAGQTYYLVDSNYGSYTGSYQMGLGIAADIPTDAYYIKNIGTGLNADIHGPWAQEFVHQWEFHISDQEDWQIQKQNDGYYTIRSRFGTQKYIGVSSASLSEDNIKLFDTISDSTRWKIYTTLNGNLFFVPKNAVGKVLYTPNDSIGTELQLSWISDSVNNRNEWTFEVRSSTPIEGQRWSNWCWATSARMLTKHYETISDVRTQNLAVSAVKGRVVNQAGNLLNAMGAVGYYHAEDTNNNDLNLEGHNWYILSEKDTRRFIDDGHVIYIARGHYSGTMRNGGHATVIVGYTTEFTNGEMQYRYIVNNPWPASTPSPWSSPVITNGQIQFMSYDLICNGLHAQSGEQQDDGIWDKYLVVSTDYSGNTVPPVMNE